MSPAHDIWFHYRIEPGRLRGWPVNTKGWAALIGLIAAPHALLWPIILGFGLHGAWVGWAFLAVTFPATFIAVGLLMKAKGQRV